MPLANHCHSSKMRLIFGLFGLIIGVTHGMEADIYLNKDKFGEFFKLEISEKGCTNVPLNWENQAVSVDTHGSCIKFYDLPYCRGKYVALQPYHGTFQDNLETLSFQKIISSASPCGPKVPTGRYYIQNGADGSVLTIEMKNHTPTVRTHAFKPYISKGQQFQLEKVALSDYEIIPRVQQNLNPLTYDMTISTVAHPVRRVWKIESVYRGRYIIKNEWNNRCLYKSDTGKVEEHECVTWSPNQEWIFRSIKVKPYFPSKEELQKKPIRPDEKLPFSPQDDSFSTIPYQPVQSNFNLQTKPLRPALPPSKKRPGQSTLPQVQITRPGPLIINPGEPFPPVFPYPIVPKITTPVGHHKQPSKPPVPHVRHPGPLPFPAEPVIMDPRVSTVSPLDTYNAFIQLQQQLNSTTPAPKKPSDDEESDEEQSDESGEDELQDDVGERGPPNKRRRPRPRPRPGSDEEQFDIDGPQDDYGPPPPKGSGPPQEDDEYGPPPPQSSQEYGPPPPSKRGKRPPPRGSRPPPPHDDDEYGPPRENDGPGGPYGPGPGDEYDGPYQDDEPEEPELRQKKRKHHEKMAGVKYSDYRLHF